MNRFFTEDYFRKKSKKQRNMIQLNINEANKYFFGTENTNEVKKLFESRDFDSDVIDGDFFYKQFDVWGKELDKFLQKFNVISLRKYMKSRALVSGMDIILRMYAEIVEENNPWSSKYVDQILTDFLDDIEESIIKNCKKGLVHMCELLGITPSRDSSENLTNIYAFGN